jgi:hypothetical protein
LVVVDQKPQKFRVELRIPLANEAMPAPAAPKASTTVAAAAPNALLEKP